VESCGDGVVAVLGVKYQLFLVRVELLEAKFDSCCKVAIVVVINSKRLIVIVLPQGLKVDNSLL
jgi:hypothetical protein